MLVYDPKAEPTSQVEGRLVDMITALQEQNRLLQLIADRMQESLNFKDSAPKRK